MEYLRFSILFSRRSEVAVIFQVCTLLCQGLFARIQKPAISRTFAGHAIKNGKQWLECNSVGMVQMHSMHELRIVAASWATLSGCSPRLTSRVRASSGLRVFVSTRSSCSQRFPDTRG